MVDEQTPLDGRLADAILRTFAAMQMAEIGITTTKIRFSADTPTQATTSGRGHGNVGGIDCRCHGPRDDFSGKIRVGRDGEITMDENAPGRDEFIPGKIPGEPVPGHGPGGIGAATHRRRGGGSRGRGRTVPPGNHAGHLLRAVHL